jgi:hypothetical protein
MYLCVCVHTRAAGEFATDLPPPPFPIILTSLLVLIEIVDIMSF